LINQSGLFLLSRKTRLALNARVISFLKDEIMSQFQGKRFTTCSGERGDVPGCYATPMPL
jgi:hypothetical protein